MDPKHSIVFLNGQYVPLSEAKISVLDRGFLFGDGVYEVIPAYRGQLFELGAHLNRLENSLKEIRMESPYTRNAWKNILNRLLCGDQDQSVYLQITRGAVEKRDHAIQGSKQPTVFAQSSPLTVVKVPEVGLSAITLPDSRWEFCNIKAITLLANSLLRQKAIDNNCAEAILVRDGFITEGAASNVFAVINNILVTPPKSQFILAGITRRLVLELAEQHSIPAREDAISIDALKRADEIWTTSSTREILPMVNLDGQPVGTGKIGPLWLKMTAVFQAFKQVHSQKT